MHEDTQKYYFTLMDFRGATNHFADPDFDGEPVQIYAPQPGQPIDPPEPPEPPEGGEEPGGDSGGEPAILINPLGQPGGPQGGAPQRKIYVDGVGAVIVAERVEYLDENGKLITESLRDFTKKAIRHRFASLDAFLKRWNAEERKQAIIDELEAEGLPIEAILAELGKDLDPFDLICHVAFDAKPLTRQERAANVQKRNAFAKYGDKARAVLDALLTKYADEGMLNLDDTNVLRIPPINTLGTPIELVKAFGGKSAYEHAVHAMQDELYKDIA